MDVEKLINLVRSNSLLYDLSHKDYKNNGVKRLVWERIGRELNQDGDIVKKKWKTVKDGYIKNKKILKGSTGSGRIVTSYIWADQMRFLDDYQLNRNTSTNITPQPDTLQPQDQPQAESPPPVQAPDQQSPESCLSPVLPLPRSPPADNRPRRAVSKERDDRTVDTIINYLQSRRNKEKDATDYLFQSYAETFKKFSPAVQTELKLEMAKLFADAENREMRQARQERPTNFSQVTYVMSPSYSMVSSADTEAGTDTIQSIHYLDTDSQSFYHESDQLDSP